jgi:type IV pilus assembly protein PilB
MTLHQRQSFDEQGTSSWWRHRFTSFAQRLIRRVKDCKKTSTPRRRWSMPDSPLPKPICDVPWQGCGTCNGTGYKGRVGLTLVMEINDDLRELILIGASSLGSRRKLSG